MKETLNIAIIFGGQSPEHEVSRKSAAFIAETLSKNEIYNLHFIAINKQGEANTPPRTPAMKAPK